MIVFTGLLLFCVGCRHSYPLTNQAPFAGYVGHDLALKRTSFLWKERFIGPLDMTDISNPVFHDNDYIVRNGDVRRVATLPAGTVMRLDRVDFAWDDEAGSGSFFAWGSTILPDTGQKVTFRYIWGGIDAIDRAPWDDDDVPSKRYVGRDGRSFKPQ